MSATGRNKDIRVQEYHGRVPSYRGEGTAIEVLENIGRRLEEEGRKMEEAVGLEEIELEEELDEQIKIDEGYGMVSSDGNILIHYLNDDNRQSDFKYSGHDRSKIDVYLVYGSNSGEDIQLDEIKSIREELNSENFYDPEVYPSKVSDEEIGGRLEEIHPEKANTRNSKPNHYSDSELDIFEVLEEILRSVI